MLKHITFCLLAFVGSIAFAGEATHNKEFELKEKPDKVVAWVKESPDAISKATHTEIVSRDGDKTRVRRETPKGTFEFTVKETITQNGESYTYDSNLVESHVGDLKSQIVKVKLSPNGSGGSKVEVEMYASVENRKISKADVKLGLIKSVRGFENMMQAKF